MMRVTFLSLFFISFFSLNGSDLRIEVKEGGEIAPYVLAIADLAVRTYYEYPFLYDGSVEEYRPIIESYSRSPEGVATLLFDEGRLIGCCMGLPLENAPEVYQKPFKDSGEDMQSVFYIGELFVDAEFRRHGLGQRLYREMEERVLSRSRYSELALILIADDIDHQLRPIDYLPIEGFVAKQDYLEQVQLTMLAHWKEVGAEKVSPHLLVYWTKMI